MTGRVIILLIAGVLLLVAEARLASYGALGIAGGAAFAAAVVLAVVCVFRALPVSRRQARAGAEGLIGHLGVVRRPLDPIGQIAIDGELWRARRCWIEREDPPPGEGDLVVVDEVRGLTLSVRRAEDWEVDP
jgi:membrane-bound serine protease (ClpP class)